MNSSLEMVANIPVPAVPMSVNHVPAEKLHDGSAEKGG